MKNSEYWKKRFEQLEEAKNNDASSLYRELEGQYSKAQRALEGQIQAWYGRFAVNNNIPMAEARKLLSTKELAEFKWDVKEYIKYGEQNELNQMWMKELENASAKYHISRLEALKLQTQNSMEVLFGNQLDGMDTLMKKLYTNGYYHTVYEVQKGFNIGWDIASIDQNKLEKIISKPWAVDGKNFSERLWGNKSKLVNELHGELTQMTILGRSPDQAIGNIAARMKTSKTNAGRLVMTESAYFASASQKDAFNDLDVERFEIVATLDSHTSAICQDLDGHVFDMKDYESGITAPPFHVWCRSTTVPYFEDNYGERAARDQDGKTYYVPSDMKYKDWEKSFVDEGSKDGLKVIEKSGNIEVPKTFKEKIQDIKDSKGGVFTEADIQQAGKLVQDELKIPRMGSKQRIDSLQKAYNETGMVDVENELNRLRQARRGLLDLNEVGLKDMGSLNVKYDELMNKKFELNPIISDLEKQLNDAKIEYRGSFNDNVSELKGKLSEIRDMGSGSFDVSSHLNNSRSPMKKVIMDAYDHYPTDWVQKSVANSNLSPKKVNRGYYSHSSKEIAISGDGSNGSLRTAFHELGHRFERTVPGVLEAEKTFYARRTAGESLQWLGGRYDYSEKSRFDKFLDTYMGKDYGGTAYELVSMGFEHAYTNPTKLWEDEDFATWIYGLLSLY